MHPNRIVPFLSMFIAAASLAVSCVGAPVPGASAGTPLSTAYTPASEPATLVLLEGDALDRWGRTWVDNPFMPQVKTLFGKQFELWAVAVRPNGNVAVVMEALAAYDASGAVVGKSYERDAFVEFWQARSDEEDEAVWEKKRRTIETYVPWYGSPFPLYAGREYVVVIVAPKDTPPPVRFELAMDVDGVRHVLTLP